jgi:hypothetical protein
MINLYPWMSDTLEKLCENDRIPHFRKDDIMAFLSKIRDAECPSDSETCKNSKVSCQKLLNKE